MADIPRFFPWQERIASAWLLNRERFAHAWLVHGLAGTGKRGFVRAAAAGLLCEAPLDGLACGRCQACRWVAGGHHPDLRLLRPEAVAAEEGDAGAVDSPSGTGTAKNPSREIRIEQLRALQTWFTTATHRGGWRVAVLYPGESLNLVSANALLKILEEPPAHTVFLIAADAPDRLLPTLVSRCRRLPLPTPEHGPGLTWLQAQGVQEPDKWLAAAGGAPVRALKLAREQSDACPVWLQDLLQTLSAGRQPAVGALADQVDRQEPAGWIDALQRLFLDLLLTGRGLEPRYFPSMRDPLQAVSLRASQEALADTAKWLAEQQAHARHPLNSKLLAHTLIQRVALACAPVPP